MRYTNLQLVQLILSSMDGDEVNSVSDTAESLQVLDIIQTVFFDIASLGELPRNDDLFSLEPSNSLALPVTMSLPDIVQDIRWLKYDCQTVDNPVVTYREVCPMPLQEFLLMVTTFTPTDTNVISYDFDTPGGSYTLYAKNDQAPKFYTTDNDRVILFDSYDAAVDDTLQRSKTMGYGELAFTFSMTDRFVAPLDDKQHQRLLHEAKSLAFAELKQSQHVKAEKTARDIRINQQSSKTKIPTQTAYDQINSMGRMTTHGHLKPTGRYK